MNKGQKDFSIRLSISEGAHSPAVLDSTVDAVSRAKCLGWATDTLQRHSLTVQPRRKLTAHVDYDLARQCLSKHFDKGLSFSTTPLEVSAMSNDASHTLQGDEVYLRKAIEDEAVLPLSLSRLGGDETPRMMSSASSDRTHASDGPW
jgi:inositol hexakisphosphate/diphosphoinositol-pentakisphosphate kinase